MVTDVVVSPDPVVAAAAFPTTRAYNGETMDNIYRGAMMPTVMTTDALFGSVIDDSMRSTTRPEAWGAAAMSAKSAIVAPYLHVHVIARCCMYIDRYMYILR